MDWEPSHDGQTKKNVRPTERPKTGATFMLRCAELGLTDEALETMTMGMVYDMLIEQANDREEWAILAPPGSMRSFFLGGGKLGE